MEKVIKNLINLSVKGAEAYDHNGSLWLIFTDRQEWIIEFDKHGDLWYNLNLFESIFSYVSMTHSDGHEHIIKWFEEISNDVVKGAGWYSDERKYKINETIQNGVKSIIDLEYVTPGEVEQIIENGSIIKNDGKEKNL